jgi:hypothetical protein
MQQPRFVGIKIGVTEPDPGSLAYYRSHRQVRVSKKSILPPSILDINREARGEALSQYELRLFESTTRSGLGRSIYYNPKVDILYFGEGACVSSIIKITNIQACNLISKIASDRSPKVVAYCDLNGSMTYRRHGSNNLMQVIHGISDDLGNYSPFPGFTGLTDIYFMVKSGFYASGKGEFNE